MEQKNTHLSSSTREPCPWFFRSTVATAANWNTHRQPCTTVHYLTHFLVQWTSNPFDCDPIAGPLLPPSPDFSLSVQLPRKSCLDQNGGSWFLLTGYSRLQYFVSSSFHVLVVIGFDPNRRAVSKAYRQVRDGGTPVGIHESWQKYNCFPSSCNRKTNRIFFPTMII